MSHEIFAWFDKWFNENKDLLSQKELQLEFSEKRGEEGIRARWVDITSSTKNGNIIVYNVGTCDTFIGDLVGELNFEASADFINSEEELDKLLKEYFEKF